MPIALMLLQMLLALLSKGVKDIGFPVNESTK